MLIIETLILSFALQVIFFTFAAINRTDKLTYLSYALTFIVLAFFTLSLNSSPTISQYLLFAIISFWGIRLAGYLWMRIIKTKKDKRFDGIREKPFKFAGFWLLQALSIWVIMLPATAVLGSKEDIFYLPFVLAGSLVWFIGFFLESVADKQKFAFKNKGKKGWINTGLWKYSQHPNYFGEITLWWGIFIFSLPYLSGLSWLVIVGPLYTTFLIIFVSGIPPLQKSYQERFGKDSKYQKYRKITSLLVPLPPRG